MFLIFFLKKRESKKEQATSQVAPVLSSVSATKASAESPHSLSISLSRSFVIRRLSPSPLPWPLSRLPRRAPLDPSTPPPSSSSLPGLCSSLLPIAASPPPSPPP